MDTSTAIEIHNLGVLQTSTHYHIHRIDVPDAPRVASVPHDEFRRVLVALSRFEYPDVPHTPYDGALPALGAHATGTPHAYEWLTTLTAAYFCVRLPTGLYFHPAMHLLAYTPEYVRQIVPCMPGSARAYRDGLALQASRHPREPGEGASDYASKVSAMVAVLNEWLTLETELQGAPA